MKLSKKRKLKLKKFYFHPITVFLFLSFIVILLSAVLEKLGFQSTYQLVNKNINDLETTMVSVESLLNFDGMKYIISNWTTNFVSFAPLASLLISLIGISVCEATGFLEAFSKKYLRKLNKPKLTFIILFLGIISSLINDVGYAILIPLAAIIYGILKRNPLLGIITAFCGVAFGYGVSAFIGSMEVSLIPYTTSAAHLIDETAHISLSSNLFIIIFSMFALAIFGTIAIEKFIAPKLSAYKEEKNFSKTQELDIIDIEEFEQRKIEKEKNQKRGLRFALVTGFIVVAIFIYMLIPNLPQSGLLLDMKQETYLNQIFGDSAYFQDGFTFMMSLLFLCVGLAYGIGAKSVKNDKDIVEKATANFEKIGSIILLMFVASQFIAIFKKTEIGTVIAGSLANLVQSLNFTGIPLIILVIVVIAVSNLFLTSPTIKWQIFSPVVVPLLMQSNVSPQFAQFIMRASDSMTNGITPLLAAFTIYLGYMNIYNKEKSKPIIITKAIKLIMPYFLVSLIVWLVIIFGWYLIGLPIGPNVYPTI